MIGKEPRYRVLSTRVTDQEWRAVQDMARDSGQSTDALLYKIIFKRGKS